MRLAVTWTSAVQPGDAAGDCGTLQQPWPSAEGFSWVRSYMHKAEAHVLLQGLQLSLQVHRQLLAVAAACLVGGSRNQPASHF